MFVLVRKTARHAVATFNRPDKRNPLPYLNDDGLLPALQQLEQDDAVRAVVLTGAGPAFCSGLDLEALKKLQSTTLAQNTDDSRNIRTFFETLRKYPKPLIAALNGPAVAGGAALVLCCDLAVAAEGSFVCFSEPRIGFVPALAGVYLARACGERVARDLLLTARRVDAAEAKALGLVSEVLPAEQVLARAEELAEAIAENSPEAIRRTRRLIADSAELPLGKALDLATRANAEARGTKDCQEGVRAFLEKRKPNWPN